MSGNRSRIFHKVRVLLCLLLSLAIIVPTDIGTRSIYASESVWTSVVTAADTTEVTANEASNVAITVNLQTGSNWQSALNEGIAANLPEGVTFESISLSALSFSLEGDECSYVLDSAGQLSNLISFADGKITFDSALADNIKAAATNKNSVAEEGETVTIDSLSIDLSFAVIATISSAATIDFGSISSVVLAIAGSSAEGDGSAATGNGETPAVSGDVEMEGLNTGGTSTTDNRYLSLAWMETYHTGATDAVGIINGDHLEVTPANNSTNSLFLKLEYYHGGTEDAAPGDIEIRIPYSIIEGREGSFVDTARDLGIGTVAGDGDTKFYWYQNGNEIIITNWGAISPGVKLSVDIQFSYLPSTVNNGSNHNITANATVKSGDGSVDNLTSNTLDATINTRVMVGSLSKYGYGTSSTSNSSGSHYSYYYNGYYSSYQPGWGDASKTLLPTGQTEDYYYVYWKINYSATANCTQPYKITFTEPPNSELKALLNGVDTGETGIFLGFASPVKESTYAHSDRTVVRTLTEGKDLTYEVSKPLTSNYYYSTFAVVAFPKSLWNDQNLAYNDYLEFPNTVTCTVDPLDSDESTLTDSGIYTFTYSKPPTIQPLSSSLTVYKSTNNLLTSGKQKSSSRKQYGAIDYLQSGETLQLGYYATVTALQWELTKDDTTGNYGEKAYTTTLTDNSLKLGSYNLTDDDYYFDRIQLTWTQYTGDETTTTTPPTDENYINYEDLEVYYRLANSSTWTHAGTLSRTGLSSYGWNSVDGESTASGNIITLPVNVAGVKAEHTGIVYKTYIRMDVSVNIKPTDAVKAAIPNVTNYISLYNYTAGTVIKEGENTATISRKDYHYYNLYASTKSSCISKDATTPVNNASKSQSTLIYTITAYTTTTNYSNWMDTAGMKEITTEQRNSVIYDLLPTGISPDQSSIAVKLYGLDTVLTLGIDYSIVFVDNWQGSNHTMMIITIHLSGNHTENWYGTLYSGFVVTYNAVYKYRDMIVYGTKGKTNSVAYYSDDGKLPGPYAKDFSTSSTSTADKNGAAVTNLSYKDYFAYTDENGTTPAVAEQSMYTQNMKDFTPLIGTLTGFYKTVKAADNTAYSAAAEVAVGSNYTYRLLYTNDDDQKSKDIVFYDFFEAWNPNSDAQWEGSFVSIDVNHPKSIGISPKVYYSTATPPVITESNKFAYSDLNNTSIWSTDPPSDLKAVTAIAVDCSKNTSSTEYTLDYGKYTEIYVTMQAPQELYSDRLLAKNALYGSAYVITTNDPITRNMERSETTEVSLREPDVSISKTSDPASGTASAPLMVEREDVIKYTITVKNTNSIIAITDVCIEDIIPADLTVDIDTIQYYFGSNTPKSITSSTRTNVSPSGQKLTFWVDKLAGQESISFVIPAKVNGSTASDTVLANTASISGYNGYEWEISSQTTYHKVKAYFGITATKVQENKDLVGKDYSFILTDAGSKEYYAQNDANGNITFEEIAYTAAGDYTYTLKEVDSGLAGIDYDGSVHTITITVVDNGDGAYKFSQSPNNIVFTNTYDYESAGFTLEGNKQLEGKSLISGQFNFIVKDADGSIVSTGTNDASGKISFSEIGISAEGTYTYMVYENTANTSDPTLVYDTTVFAVTVTATDNSGELKLDVQYPDGGIVFKNSYRNGVTLTKVDASSGVALAGAVFELYTADGKLVGTYTTDADGKVRVNELAYGDYYFIEITAPNGYQISRNKLSFTISSVNTVVEAPNTRIIITEGNTDIDNDSDSNPDSNIDSGSNSHSDSGSDSDVDSGSNSHSDSGLDSDADSNSNSDSGSVPDIESGSDSNSESNSDSDNDSDSYSDNDSDSDTGSDSDTYDFGERIVLGTTNPNNEGLTAIQMDDTTYTIYNEYGTPLGTITVLEGMDVDEIDILDNLNPLGSIDTPLYEDSNPKTGDDIIRQVSLLVVISGILVLLLAVKKRSA